MSYTNTIIGQLLSHIPRYHFESIVKKYNGNRYIKSLTAWNQLVALLIAQASQCDSLREIETYLSMHQTAWNHLQINTIARSTLSYSNANRDWHIYEELFKVILTSCKELQLSDQKLLFNHPLFSLDSSVIGLSISHCPWATYQRSKGALKLHTLLSNETILPELICVTAGSKNDARVASQMDIPAFLPKNSIITFDRGYIDYIAWQKLHNAGHIFVTRVRKNQEFDFVSVHTECHDNILGDVLVVPSAEKSALKYTGNLRLITIKRDNGETWEYLTNDKTYTAEEIALIYKHRWQIETFFKWIKQNLKIKSFLGTTFNAIMTQIWTAMIYYLLTWYIHYQTKFHKPLSEFLTMIRSVLFDRRSIIDLLKLDSTSLSRFKKPPDLQLELF
jgi:hypothetical protein